MVKPGNRNKSKQKAQAALEYFLIFSIILGATIISAQVLWPAIRDKMQGKGDDGEGGLYQAVGERLVTADQGGAGTWSQVP